MFRFHVITMALLTLSGAALTISATETVFLALGLFLLTIGGGGLSAAYMSRIEVDHVIH